MKRLSIILRLIAVFIVELIKANIEVALWILKPNSQLRPAFVAIPLDLKNESALVVFAQMITLTPGTLSLEFTPDRDELLIHVIHTLDPAATVMGLKKSFEAPLMQIFGESGGT